MLPKVQKSWAQRSHWMPHLERAKTNMMDDGHTQCLLRLVFHGNQSLWLPPNRQHWGLMAMGLSGMGLYTQIEMFLVATTNLTLQMIWCRLQGWGQFHFFNSIPIPIPLFSIPIPIPIPLLTKSFNSNSNSGDFNSNSNSNSGFLKSRQSQFWKWPVDVFLEIDYDYTNKVHCI